MTIETHDLEIEILDPLFTVWWDFAVRTEGYFSQAARELIGPDDHPPVPKHKWHWDGPEHVDPSKEASALTERLRNGSDHLANAWSKKGKIWEQERKLAAKSLGLDEDEYLAHIRTYLFTKGRAAKVENGISPAVTSLVENTLEELTQ